IYFTDAVGNPLANQFADGEVVLYSSSGAAIDGLTNGHIYKVTGASTYAVQLGATDTLSVTFHNNGPGQKSTITRSDGGSWRTDGFRGGQTITVSGGGANNGHYTLDSVDDMTLTLTAVDTGITETDTKTIDGSAITLTPDKSPAGASVVH